MNNGNGAASLIQIIRKHGYNQDVNIELATVISPHPTVKIRLAGGLELDNDDVIIAEHLTEHKRTISIVNGKASGTVSPTGNLSTFALIDAEMTIESPLKAGDKVFIMSAQGGQKYYVLDKAVVN